MTPVTSSSTTFVWTPGSDPTSAVSRVNRLLFTTCPATAGSPSACPRTEAARRDEAQEAFAMRETTLAVRAEEAIRV